MTRSDSNSSDQSANQDDAVWLDLVSRLEGRDTQAAAGEGSEPSRRPFRDFDPLGLAGAAPTEPSASERQGIAHNRGNAETQGSAETGTGPRDYEADDDEPFVPEEPPSLAGTDPLTMLAWLGAVGGPVALVLSAMFWRSAPLLAILGIVAAFVLSVIYLIMQLPQEKDEHDDGARV
ncbi:hypothetical protein [Arthrobacter sp. ISL-72]|uniref:hypothetical protein n=1 Tax=Arthrobacter sp. ISL-72 TaxID=2819114 RepID=UPI001BEA0D6D|nr:hypothetical protein [Arthrobacter sp. ISL-72]MBT2597744.1 hypothetical protein [Arthrobacter sp. ISL-72]